MKCDLTGLLFIHFPLSNSSVNFNEMILNREDQLLLIPSPKKGLLVWHD